MEPRGYCQVITPQERSQGSRHDRPRPREVHGSLRRPGHDWAVLTRRQSSKGKLLEVTAKMGSCRIGMEACCGDHHRGRLLLAHGHDVKLMAANYVRAFFEAGKMDARDANACGEACLRPTMRFLPLRSEEQLSMQSLHRYCSRLVGNSTRLIKQAHAFLLDRGVAIPHGKHRFAAQLPEILEDADNGPGPTKCGACWRTCWSNGRNWMARSTSSTGG